MYNKQLQELFSKPSYTINISSKEITHQSFSFSEKRTYYEIDHFIKVMEDLRKSDEMLWYVIPPGLIDPPSSNRTTKETDNNEPN